MPKGFDRTILAIIIVANDSLVSTPEEVVVGAGLDVGSLPSSDCIGSCIGAEGFSGGVLDFVHTSVNQYHTLSTRDSPSYIAINGSYEQDLLGRSVFSLPLRLLSINILSSRV